MIPSSPRNAPPMAEPGRRTSGASTGGIAQSADRGIADSLERDSERLDDDVAESSGGGETGRATPDVGHSAVGGAAVRPRLAAAGQDSGTTRTTHPARGFEDEAEDDAQVPKALPDSDEPRDESAAQSLGRSISQVLTGGTHENKVEGSGRPKRR